MNIFKLFGSIFVENDKANKSISETDSKAESLGKKFLGGAKTVAKFGAAVGTMAVGAGAAMFNLAKNMGETSAEILKFSKVSGMSTKKYQEWDKVMKKFGFTMEDASGDMAALAEKALDASMGVGESAELFEKLGIVVTDTQGTLKTQGQIFDEVVTSLQGMSNTTERNAIASALLGTTGEELIPVLSMTADELNKVKDSANIISQDDLEKSVEFKERVDAMAGRVKVFGENIALKAMPFLTDMMDMLEDNGPALERLFTAVLEAVELLLPVLLDVLGVITKIIEGALKAIEKMGEVVSASREAEASGASSGVFTGSSKHKQPSNTSGFALGGTTLTDGVVKVGERGPELLSLPGGATVSPLTGMGGGSDVNLTIEGSFINEQGVEDMMNMVIEWLTSRGVRVV